MKFCACTRPQQSSPVLAKISANIYDFTTERHDIPYAHFNKKELESSFYDFQCYLKEIPISTPAPFLLLFQSNLFVIALEIG